MLKTRIPPPLYALLAAYTMYWLDHHLPGLRLNLGPWAWLGWLLIAAGIALDGVAIAGFVRARTTVNPLRPETARQLVVTGPYRFSRNPMYLGLLLCLGGWAVLLGSLSPPFVLIVFARLIVVLQIRPEEALLESRFGQSYRDYCSSVGRWLGRT
jgi:protein-S-isoprenylcysteine O-methyltransferase Ste14